MTTMDTMFQTSFFPLAGIPIVLFLAFYIVISIIFFTCILLLAISFDPPKNTGDSKPIVLSVKGRVIAISIVLLLTITFFVLMESFNSAKQASIWWASGAFFLFMLGIGLLFFKSVISDLRAGLSKKTFVSLWESLLLFFVTTIITIFGFNTLSHLDNPLASSWLRVPIGESGGIAVDTQGRIFCLSNSYNRIMVFDENGQFQTGWSFTMDGNLNASIQLIIDDNGYLHVENDYYKRFGKGSRRHVIRYNVYNPDGEFIEYSSKFADLKLQDTRLASDSNGNVYAVRRSPFYSAITKTSPSGETTVLVTDPLLLKLISFPESWVLGAVFWLPPMLIFKYYQRKRKARESRESKPIGNEG